MPLDRRPVWAPLTLCLLLGAASCAPRAADPAAPPAGPPLLDPDHPAWRTPAPDRFRARFETSEGPFVVEVTRAWAPRGADRLYHLVCSGFFDDSRFFRVRAGYIVQFGIPGEPRVARAWRSRTLVDDPVRQSNLRGTIGYAMTGDDTRTTQLFINLVDNPQLNDQGFAPVGRVVSGMESVDRLHAGYGESAGGGMRGGRQDPLFEEGNAYLDRHYPELDRLVRAEILDPDPCSAQAARQG